MKLIKGLSFFVCLIIASTACADGDQASDDQVEAVSGAEQIQLTPAQIKLGKRSFIRCQACHTLGQGEAHLTGPNLHGLFSAVAGEKEGFVYSEALLKSNAKWTDENLREWLKTPFTFIPGNKMAFAGIQSERELDALMAYLRLKTQ